MGIQQLIKIFQNSFCYLYLYIAANPGRNLRFQFLSQSQHNLQFLYDNIFIQHEFKGILKCFK